MMTTLPKEVFFDFRYQRLIDSPNGNFWFMSMPLPNGDRISGVSPNKNREQKLWHTCFNGPSGNLNGKHILDIGANDGYFTIAALLSGASSATAINTEELIHRSYPANLEYASHLWQVKPIVHVGDFMTADLPPDHFDVIFFLGVLYHVENVYMAFRTLKKLLNREGTICLETQATSVSTPHPIFEMASDTFDTTVPQYKNFINTVGNSNYFLPNDTAIHCLAETFDLTVDIPKKSANKYSEIYANMRRVYFLRHRL